MSKIITILDEQVIKTRKLDEEFYSLRDELLSEKNCIKNKCNYLLNQNPTSPFIFQYAPYSTDVDFGLNYIIQFSLKKKVTKTNGFLKVNKLTQKIEILYKLELKKEKLAETTQEEAKEAIFNIFFGDDNV